MEDDNKNRETEAQDPKQKELDLGIMGIIPINRDSDQLIAPRLIVASSLFTARNKKQPRAFIKDQALAVAPGLGTLKYRGEELRMYDDKKVWQSIINLAIQEEIHKTNFILTSTTYQLLKEIGYKSKSSLDYEHLKECLERLKATAITAVSNSGNKIKSVSLISKYVIDYGKLEIHLDKDIYRLFHKGDVTFLSLRAMHEMPVLTQKIYEIIKADVTREMSVAEYMSLTGNNYKFVRQFKPKLIASLNELKEKSYITGWSIDKMNIVSIQKD